MQEPDRQASGASAGPSGAIGASWPPFPVNPHQTGTGEQTIRNTVIQWYGPPATSETAGRTGRNEHHETILESLLRLHAVSCSLVSRNQRLPLPEQDVLAAIQTLNHIEATLHCPPRVIASRCAIRTLREPRFKDKQLDPLQLRHLLTFHPDAGATESRDSDFAALRSACKSPDKHAIHAWFETVGRNKSSLPKDLPQLLRQLATELWHEGHHDFFDVFATDLAVLDARMFGLSGWENTRQYFSIFKRVNGDECGFASSFLKPEEIHLAISLYEELGDKRQAEHFRKLAQVYDEASFRHFEGHVLAAARESTSRPPFETASASPFALTGITQPEGG